MRRLGEHTISGNNSEPITRSLESEVFLRLSIITTFAMSMLIQDQQATALGPYQFLSGHPAATGTSSRAHTQCVRSLANGGYMHKVGISIGIGRYELCTYALNWSLGTGISEDTSWRFMAPCLRGHLRRFLIG
jgi:hypothetical protein